MNREEALEPFARVRSELEKIASSLGLTLEAFGILMADDPNMTNVHVTFSVRADAVMSEAEKEQAQIDRQYDDIQRTFIEAEMLEKRAPTVRDQVSDFLDGFDNT